MISIPQTLKTVFRNPLIIAVLLTLPFSYFGMHLPETLDTTGQYFANLTLPMALLTIGGTLDLKSQRQSSGMPRAMGAHTKLSANIILITTLGSVLSLSGGIFVLRLMGLI